MRILILRLSSFGDIIHSFYAISDLQHALPNAKIEIVVEPTYLELAKLHPYIKEVHAFAFSDFSKLGPYLFFRQLFKFISKLRSSEFDYVLDPHSIYKSAIVSMLSGGRLRFGLERHRSEGLAHLLSGRLVCIEGPAQLGPRLFFSRIFNYSLDGLPLRSGIEASLPRTAEPKVWPHRQEVAFMPFGSSKIKHLPFDLSAGITRTLEQRGLATEILWGSVLERKVAIEIASATDRSYAAEKCYSFNELATRLKNTTLLISTDTGVLHLGAALGIRCLAIFGPTSSKQFFREDPVRGLWAISKQTDYPSLEAINSLLDCIINGDAPKL
jgi:heptosyltransferase-1